MHTGVLSETYQIFRIVANFHLVLQQPLLSVHHSDAFSILLTVAFAMFSVLIWPVYSFMILVRVCAYEHSSLAIQRLRWISRRLFAHSSSSTAFRLLFQKILHAPRRHLLSASVKKISMTYVFRKLSNDRKEWPSSFLPEKSLAESISRAREVHHHRRDSSIHLVISSVSHATNLTWHIGKIF